MEEKHLHIITHDVPYPADFGGVVDLFYKIRTLHQNGIRIHLHCFVNKRPAQKELEKFCASVHYYPRETGIKGISLQLPFIVSSRKSTLLLENLSKDKYPVLLEGIHCSYFLYKGLLKDRKIILRLHNVEFEYYRQLAKHENNLFKKLYFMIESLLLKRYEKSIAGLAPVACVSEHDVMLYKKHFNVSDIFYLPVFIPYTEVRSAEGKGSYCLYHGNLSVNENEEAVMWLLQHVFNDLTIPFVIAGKDPSKRLEKQAHHKLHTCLVANPDESEMQDMIEKAHINILPSFNNTGVKLKLLNAVFNGRFCLVNKAGAEGSGLEKLCLITDCKDEMKKTIATLYETPFTKKMTEERSDLLKGMYNNQRNAEKLIELLW